MVGLDPEGHDFIRTTHTAINAVRPDMPVVDMPLVHRGYYDETATLTCNVTSIVPFTVQWYREGEELGNPLYFRSAVKFFFHSSFLQTKTYA